MESFAGTWVRLMAPRTAPGLGLGLGLALALCAAACDDGPLPPGDADRSRTDFPRALLDEPMLFGGTIVRVSDPLDEALGSLKLFSFGPLRVRPVLDSGPGGQAVMLAECGLACDSILPDGERYPLTVLATSEDSDGLRIDLKDLGEMLNIAPLADLDEYYATETVTDFIAWENNTLVFDSHSDVAIQPLDPGGQERSVIMTVRWYLKPVADLDRDFAPRVAHDQVGFFRPDDRPDAPIRRISTSSSATGGGRFHYFIKNVPDEYHSTFEAAFEDWNRVFRDELAIEPLSYEFVSRTDPLTTRLVAGDVRYNVVEWDLNNQAYYGGLGPSFADPLTGQIFGAAVLLQGPAIVELYAAWFAGQRSGLAALTDGEGPGIESRAQAQARRAILYRQVQERAARPPRARVSLGQLAARRPPDAARYHRGSIAYDFAFDDPPGDQTFESYMQGYFREILAHELGHNLGLTHNFLGSLGDDGAEVSSDSVMEYTWRKVRHKTRVGSYDVAAIRYGYDGVLPDGAIRYCENEHVPSLEERARSAECSYNDGGADPFAFFAENRLRRAVDLAIGRDTPGVIPAWGSTDVIQPFSDGLHGMIYYGITAEATSTTWTNFFTDATRPTAPADIRTYVAATIREIVCDPSIPTHLQANRALLLASGLDAARNWDALVASARDTLVSAGLDANLCIPRNEAGFSY